MIIKDLAGKEHWNDCYSCRKKIYKKNWTPKGYNSKIIEHILLKEINQCNPKNILEIGCGNSTWLPYLSKITHAEVAGIDYSEEGCLLALKQLKVEGIQGKIFCEDIFKANPEIIGQYDLVYSLGVVEHFSDVTKILKEELRFVKAGGTLLTGVPNLKYSIHGFLARIYQPQLLNKHNRISKEELIKAHESCFLKNIEGDYAGIFSLGIIAWGKYPRWERISKYCVPFIQIFVFCVDYMLSKIKYYKGFRLISPYIFVSGEK